MKLLLLHSLKEKIYSHVPLHNLNWWYSKQLVVETLKVKMSNEERGDNKIKLLDSKNGCQW